MAWLIASCLPCVPSWHLPVTERDIEVKDVDWPSTSLEGPGCAVDVQSVTIVQPLLPRASGQDV